MEACPPSPAAAAPTPPQETWLIYYGDVGVGAIAERAGNPPGTDGWQWHCGFYPGSHPAEHAGVSLTFYSIFLRA
jgi:hypothetical protein